MLEIPTSDRIVQHQHQPMGFVIRLQTTSIPQQQEPFPNRCSCLLGHLAWIPFWILHHFFLWILRHVYWERGECIMYIFLHLTLGIMIRFSTNLQACHFALSYKVWIKLNAHKLTLTFFSSSWSGCPKSPAWVTLSAPTPLARLSPQSLVGCTFKCSFLTHSSVSLYSSTTSTSWVSRPLISSCVSTSWSDSLSSLCSGPWPQRRKRRRRRSDWVNLAKSEFLAHFLFCFFFLIIELLSCLGNVKFKVS